MRIRLNAVPADWPSTFPVNAGATLRVIDPEGGQLTDLLAYPTSGPAGAPLFTVVDGAPAACSCGQPFPAAFASGARAHGAACSGFHLFASGSPDGPDTLVELRAERDLMVGLAPCRGVRRARPGAIAYLIRPPAP